MGLFDWFRRLSKAPVAAPVPAEPPAPIAPPEPESQWQAGVEAGSLWMIDPQGNRHSAAVDELMAVAIKASDSGPDGRSAWWLFYGPDEDVAFTLPLGARGEGVMVERIAAMPDFRHDMYAAAIRSTDIDTYVVWQRPFD